MSPAPLTSQVAPQLKVSEIFYSIQGESSFAGLPCVFIRLGGCNLRCNYCDASYTWEEGEMMDSETILARVDSYPCDLIEVTGGEPLFQESCSHLLQRLLTAGKRVLLETNGSIDIGPVPEPVTVIVDVKCPDSGSGDSFHTMNVKRIKERLNRRAGSVELKFVLSSREDYTWAKDYIENNNLGRVPVILFSPVEQRLAPRELAAWLMADGLDVRLQLQLHTRLWPDVSRGV
ncbi:MAG: radical SAM protein [Thermodesulfobacteriota bacterium]